MNSISKKRVRFLLASLLAAALGLTGCDVNFIPDIDPLILSTAGPAAISELNSEADDTPPIEGSAAPLSPLDPDFDPEDLQMCIDAIEDRWTNVDVVSCMGQELTAG